MNNLYRYMVFALFVAASGGISLQVAAQEYKVGYVDMLRVAQVSPQYQRLQEALRQEFEPRGRELEAEQQELRDMEEKLVKDGAIMSETERARLETDIRDKGRVFSRESEIYAEDVNFRRNELQAAANQEVITVLQDYAASNGYDLLLPAEVVVFGTARMDITEQVIEHLTSSGD